MKEKNMDVMRRKSHLVTAKNLHWAFHGDKPKLYEIKPLMFVMLTVQVSFELQFPNSIFPMSNFSILEILNVKFPTISQFLL